MEQNKSKKALSIAGAVLFFVIAYFGARYLTGEAITGVQIANTPKNEYIDMAISSVKNQNVFPKEIDEVTTWTDITGTTDAVQYHYTLHDFEASTFDVSALREDMILSLCNTPETRRFLDKEITMEYYYSIQDSPQVYTIKVTKADCS